MRNDALRVVSELATSQHNVFTTAQAALHGLSRRTLVGLCDTGLISEPHRGVFVVAPGEASWSDRAVAAVTATSPSAISHVSAAHHHQIDGVPVTNLARTLCDLGSVCEPLMVERALDDVPRRGKSAAWIRQTAERLHRPGQRGTGVLLEALDRHERRGIVRGSWFEKLVEMCLRDSFFGEVTIQHPLYDEDGRLVCRLDLAIPDAMLGVEAHSRRHHFGEEAEASDDQRDDEASVAGWDIMYLGYGAIRSPSTVHRRVRRRVEARRRLIGGTDRTK